MIVVIEGGDQAGKKTQSALLAKYLRANGLKTRVFSFPDYSTRIGKEIKKYLAGRYKLSPQTVHCLLSANRWEKLDKIKNAVSENSIVIMNRYYQSNLVYGKVNGMKPGWLENLDSGLPKPDLVILLDVTQSESFRRKTEKRDRFEKDWSFSQKVSLEYRKMAKKKRWRIINASSSKADVHNEIKKYLQKKLRYEKKLSRYS